MEVIIIAQSAQGRHGLTYRHTTSGSGVNQHPAIITHVVPLPPKTDYTNKDIKHWRYNDTSLALYALLHRVYSALGLPQHSAVRFLGGFRILCSKNWWISTFRKWISWTSIIRQTAAPLPLSYSTPSIHATVDFRDCSLIDYHHSVCSTFDVRSLSLLLSTSEAILRRFLPSSSVIAINKAFCSSICTSSMKQRLKSKSIMCFCQVADQIACITADFLTSSFTYASTFVYS